MAGCFSLVATTNRCFKYSFRRAGLKSSTTDLGDGSVVHFWIPKKHKLTKPTLILIHGIGANAMWQWSEVISPLISKFNLYVPDLLFYGDSYTTRPERTESFQAQCVMATLEKLGVVKNTKLNVAGLSYGGFVAYSMAAQFPEAVEKVVIIGSGVALEENDLEAGLFSVENVNKAAGILLFQTTEKARELVQYSFYKPPRIMPSCFVVDFIDVMNTVSLQERKELIEALHKGRKLSDLPKITQPTLILWGEHDKIFPVELGHRLKRHLGENAELVIVKKAGHAINMEGRSELLKHLMAFFLAPQRIPKHESNGGIGPKVD